MSPDERTAAEMTELVHAFKGIGGALERLAIVAEKWFSKTYPERTPREAIVTKVPSADDRLRENLGLTGDQTLEEWSTLGEEETVGRREREWVETHKKTAK